MGLFKSIVKAIWFAFGMFSLVILGNFFIPGKILDSTFSVLGVTIFFSTMVLDYFFAFDAGPGAK